MLSESVFLTVILSKLVAFSVTICHLHKDDNNWVVWRIKLDNICDSAQQYLSIEYNLKNWKAFCSLLVPFLSSFLTVQLTFN